MHVELRRSNRDAIEDSAVAPMDDQTLDFHRKTGLAIVAYTSQAHGFFSKASSDPAADDQIPL